MKIDVEGEGIFEIRKDMRHRPTGTVYTNEKGKNSYFQFYQTGDSYIYLKYLPGINAFNDDVYIRIIC